MIGFLERRRLVFLLIVCASILPHLKGLAAPMLDYHYHRQCNTAAIARNYYENGLHFFFPQIDWEGGYRGRSATEFPLYMWLMGLLWPLLGLGDIWGRILSSAFSALTAVYLFKFLENKIEKEAALYGSLFFSFIPLEIYFGRTVQPEAIALFSTVAAFYHWEKSLQGLRPWRDWMLALLFSFLGISHKLPTVYMLLPLATLSWLNLKERSFRDPRTLLACPLVLAAVYAWYRYASAGVYVVPSHPGEFLIMLEYGRLPYFIWFQFFSRLPELAATYGGIVLMWFGARELYKRGQIFFAIWFASICAVLIAGGGYSFHHEYTSLPFVPVNAALMGVGLYTLKQKALERGSWARAGLLLLVLSVPIHAGLRIKHWYNTSYAYLKNAQKAADQVSSPEDLFVCNERASSVYLYYLNRRGWSWDLAEAGEKRLGEIDDKIRQGAKYYMTYKNQDFKNRSGALAQYYYSRFPVIYDADEILIFRLSR